MPKKSATQLQREIDEALRNASSFKIGDAVQFRSEPGTGGVIRRFESNGWARVATPRGERSVPTYALVLVREEHEPRVRRSVSGKRSHATKATPSEPIYTLSTEELQALRTFANANGRSWKSKLNTAWMTGRYPGTDDYGTLQLIRNRFGPSWLVRFSFDRPKTHSVKG